MNKIQSIEYIECLYTIIKRLNIATVGPRWIFVDYIKKVVYGSFLLL